MWRLCGDRTGPQGRSGGVPYLTGMTTPTATERQQPMTFLRRQRQRGVPAHERDATVVLAIAGVDVARWPLGGSARPDLDVIDALARQALTARRLGGTLRLRDAGPTLRELIRFVGLDDVVAVDDGSASEAGR
jgi:hypothetical protein